MCAWSGVERFEMGSCCTRIEREWGVERVGRSRIFDLIGGGVVGRRRIGRTARKGKAISGVRGLGIVREGPRSELDGAHLWSLATEPRSR